MLSPPSSSFGGFSPVTRPGFFFVPALRENPASLGEDAGMAQALWYLRHNGRVLGPFPSPQIIELLDAGDVTPEWEISLNEADWLTIGESGQFNAVRAQWLENRQPETDKLSWREERARARQRWLKESEGLSDASVHDPRRDEQTRMAIQRDHSRTEALLEADKHRRKSLIAPLLAILLLLVVGIGVWWGQREKPIQAGIANVPNCAAPAAEGVNWTRCDKHGLQLTGMHARNAKLAGARLDDARLAGADLGYAVLVGASLRNAELSGANLVGADLTGADLAGADLTGADLQYAVLKAANLTGTRLDSAILDKALWSDGRTCAEGSRGQCL